MVRDQEDVARGRIVLGRSGDTADVDHRTELADARFVLGMDRFGLNVDITFGIRADTPRASFEGGPRP